MGYAEMASDGLPQNAPAARYVQEIHRAGARAQDLVARILEFGTRGRSGREVVRVDTLLAETASMLRASLPQAAVLVVAPGAHDGYVVAEPAQLQQAIVNLVRNAVEASQPGEGVTLVTSCEDVLAARHLSHGTVGLGPHLRIAVIDTGIGMDSATLEQIFRPFFTTRPAGTGLGLATVREIVQDQAGVLDVRSQPGRGSTFEIWLPAAELPGAPEPKPTPGNGQTILVLADDPASVLQDEEILAALGYEPIGFTNSASALAAISAEPTRFDAVLVSAGVARNANWRLLSLLAQSAPSTPIIVATSGSEELRLLPREHVAAALLRPLRSASLSAALAGCLQQRECPRQGGADPGSVTQFANETWQ